MKKSLLFLSALSFCVGTTAQITLNTSDVAGVNKVIYNATDTMVSASMIGFAGASQIWNMTALTSDLKDTLTFLAYSSAPNSKFSTANLVMKQGYGNNYVYAINSSSSLTVLGFAGYFGTAPVTQTVSPPEILMNFPATYNTAFTNNYQTNAKFYYGQSGIDSVRQKSIVKKTVLVDAWGYITTPYAGGPYAALRVKETKITLDTTDAFFFGNWVNGIIVGADSTTTYTWWAKTIGFPLATATMDSLGGVRTMEWLQGKSAVGITETPIAVPGISVYPNPAQYEVNFVVEALKASTVKIYDITGRMIHEHAFKYNQSTVNTTHFANGIYTYSIIGEDNIILKQGKFAVSR